MKTKSNILNQFQKYLEFISNKKKWIFVEQDQEVNQLLHQLKSSPQENFKKKQEDIAYLQKEQSQKRQFVLTESQEKINKPPEQLYDKKQIYASKNNLDSLHLCISDCQACDLCLNRKKVVFGQGNHQAKIMFVGEGPGVEEDNQGLPFVGRSGQFLTLVINAIGLNRNAVYITNIVKCRPPQNRNPEKEEMNQCIDILNRQIAIIKPQLIIAVGSIAMKELITGTTSILKQSGEIFDFHNIAVIPIYHPAYVLRNPQAIEKLWYDMRKIRSYIFKSKIY